MKADSESDPVVEDPPPPPPPTCQTILSPDALAQTLYLLDEFCHELAMVQLSLPRSLIMQIFYIIITVCCAFVLICSSYKVKYMRMEISHTIEIECVPAPYHGAYRPFAAFLTLVITPLPL